MKKILLTLVFFLCTAGAGPGLTNKSRIPVHPVMTNSFLLANLDLFLNMSFFTNSDYETMNLVFTGSTNSKTNSTKVKSHAAK